MRSCLRSPAFLASTLDALVGADARPQALLALAPAAVMLAYLRSTAFLVPALAAVVGAYLRSPSFRARAPWAIMFAFKRHPSVQRCLRKIGSPRLQDHSSVSSNGKVNLHPACFELPEEEEEFIKKTSHNQSL